LDIGMHARMAATSSRPGVFIPMANKNGAKNGLVFIHYIRGRVCLTTAAPRIIFVYRHI
jgi:hypothetical protein